MAPLATITVTIPNGQSLSGATPLVAGAVLLGIHMPAAWTAAGITFQVSDDGTTFRNMFDKAGAEVTVASPAADLFMDLTQPTGFKGIGRGAHYLKVRSGTAGTPVAQGAARDLKLVFADAPYPAG